jgi:mRNA-degrading endonuclease RelE of RelBE toxin-antitoxin system
LTTGGYRVLFLRQFEKALRKLDHQWQEQVKAKCGELAATPMLGDLCTPGKMVPAVYKMRVRRGCRVFYAVDHIRRAVVLIHVRMKDSATDDDRDFAKFSAMAAEELKG